MCRGGGVSMVPKLPTVVLVVIYWVVFVLLTAAFQTGRCAAAADTDLPSTVPKEAQALNTIFRKWNISAGMSKARWNLSSDICWGLPLQIGQNFESDDRNPYIVCNCEYDDGKTCHIIKLKALELGIVGQVPEELQELTHLENLQIARNYLTGPLPAFIGNFSKMQYLSVGRNALSGPVPRELGKLKALKSLGIDTCNFSGPLPAELGNLNYLEQMYIDSMGVNGTIPESFVNLQKLQTWWAGDNNFGGKVPDFIGRMTNLQSLKFQGNDFQGPIPRSFANLTRLTLLHLSDLGNGSSSLEFIKNMTLLETLVLRDSQISDVLPPDFGKFTNLNLLDMSFNNLSGSLSPSLFKLPKLQHLSLESNNLYGGLPEEKSPRLLTIDLSYNNLSGNVPQWQSDTGLKLNLVANNFDDSSNGLPGNLRCLQKDFPCYRDFPAYYSFDINCGGDEDVASDGTHYSADNMNLGITSYYLKNNYRWAVSSTGTFIGATSPNYTEYRSTNISNTRDPKLFQTVRLSPSSLRYYGLALENGNYTISLKFAELTFPDDYSSSSLGRRIFDIYLQGTLVAKDFEIRREAGYKSFTAVIRNYTALVKSNFLEIQLLWRGKGTTAIPEYGYYGPSIAAISVSPNFTPTVPNHLPPKKKTALIVGVTVGTLSALLVLITVAFLLWRKKRQNADDDDLDGLEDIPNTFSVSELKNATKDFSFSNKLGEGGYGAVFKGKLNDGTMVAVKQLSATTDLQGKRQFVTEIATISAVQHRNLVKLHGCCYEGGHRLLVYELLENSSLDFALFGKRRLELDWPARYNICVGTARGLAYLHEESRMRIIHRDVKASNILLDAELNPKISDFGLAKLCDDKMTHVSTRVAGTIGYLAPEYALRGHLTEKADVYGFGIVVLEILTGRPNTATNSKGEKMYLLDWAWEIHEADMDLEMIDPRLACYNKEEAIRLISLAFLCTQSDPTLRPPMSRAVAILVGDMEISNDAISKPAYLADWKYDEEHCGDHTDEMTSSTVESSSTQFISTEGGTMHSSLLGRGKAVVGSPSG